MRRLLLLIYIVLPVAAFAQADGGAQGADAPVEFGLHLGELLPNQIAGVSEIMGLGGGRVGLRISPLTYFEGGAVFGNGEGQKWRNVHGSIRIDFPVSTMVGLGYVGVDGTYYDPVDQSSRLIFGGHAGGGVQAHLLGPCWFRGDMKFTFSPGVSLYIGFGLTWRLGSSAGA